MEETAVQSELDKETGLQKEGPGTWPQAAGQVGAWASTLSSCPGTSAAGSGKRDTECGRAPGPQI